MLLAAEDDALIREIENNLNRNQQLDTNVMYDPATRTGIVCVNGRCITNTPGGKNTVIQEERLGMMRPGPKSNAAMPRLIDKDGNRRQQSNQMDNSMFTEGMISPFANKENMDGQKAWDFSG